MPVKTGLFEGISISCLHSPPHTSFSKSDKQLHLGWGYGIFSKNDFASVWPMGITQGSVQTNGLSHLFWQKWEVSHLLRTAGHHTFHVPGSWTNLLPIQDQSQHAGGCREPKGKCRKSTHTECLRATEDSRRDLSPGQQPPPGDAVLRAGERVI